MLLRVEDEPIVVDAAVQVDRHVGHAGHRALEIDEALLDAAAGLLEEHAPRKREIAIEPGREEHAAVDLDAELLVAAHREIGVGLDAEVGRVGVRADHAKPAGRRRLFADDEGEDRRAPAHHVAPLARRELPGVDLGERAKAGEFEAPRGLADGVEGRRRGVDEGAEIAGSGDAGGAGGGSFRRRSWEAIAEIRGGRGGSGMGAQSSPRASEGTIVGASTEMKIRSLTMKDYRGFADATLDLDRPLTVLFGVNGSGKSSVLAACAVTLSQLLHESLQTEGDSKWTYDTDDTDIRRGAEKLSLNVTLANGNITREVTAQHSIGAKNHPATTTHAANLSLGHKPLVSVFYDASRAVVSSREAFSLRKTDSNTMPVFPFSVTHDSLAAGHLKFRSLFQWFKAREDIENELKVAQQDLTLEDPQLSAVRRAIAGMLPGFSGLRIQRDPLHMMIRKGDTALVLDQLSDGEKLLLALTADLARRLAMSHADQADPLQGEAIVLIDEIELHLHPTWQRRVLASMHSTFPTANLS